MRCGWWAGSTAISKRWTPCWQALRRRPQSPRKALVFNGDFHWFDAEPGWFRQRPAAQVNAGTAATRGNVETELARDASWATPAAAAPTPTGSADASGGAQQPHHSSTCTRPCRPSAPRPQLAALPLVPARRGGRAWPWPSCTVTPTLWPAGRLSHEAMQAEHADATTPPGKPASRLRSDVRAFASSHTCMPVLQGIGAKAAGW